MLTGLLILAIAAAVPVFGQETTGHLTGVVTDTTGAVLPDVSVTVTNLATQQTIVIRTDSAGNYYARELRSGRYSIRLEREGFTRAEVPDILVTVGKTFKVDVTMTVGAVEQTIEVTGTAPLIDVAGTTVAQNLSNEEFDLLPKGRSFQSLAISSAFVNEGEVEGGIQINGASGAENNYMVDGLSNTSLINGKSRQDATMEYLQEVRIKTNGIEAEFGGALGGVVTAVTKSGGNEFHGEGHYYYFGNGVNASPVKRLVLDTADDQTVGYFQDEKQKNNNSEAGGSLGGYLIKNKLYFYTGASPRWQRRENDYLFSNGTEPGTLSQKRLYMSLFNKISFDPHERVRTNFSWLYTPTYSSGTLPAYTSYANAISSSLASNEAQRTRGFYTPQSGYTGNIDLMVSNTSIFPV
jgi:hypothetical protein